jgi:hypothetical protein
VDPHCVSREQTWIPASLRKTRVLQRYEALEVVSLSAIIVFNKNGIFASFEILPATINIEFRKKFLI